MQVIHFGFYCKIINSNGFINKSETKIMKTSHNPKQDFKQNPKQNQIK